MLFWNLSVIYVLPNIETKSVGQQSIICIENSGNLSGNIIYKVENKCPYLGLDENVQMYLYVNENHQVSLYRTLKNFFFFYFKACFIFLKPT